MAAAKSIELQLPENLTIAHVNNLHEQMESLINQQDHDAISVQADAVSRIDTAGVQLLFAFSKSAKEHSISLTWKSPSETLVGAAKTLGLDTSIGFN